MALRWSFRRRRRRRPDEYHPTALTRALQWCAGADPGLLTARVEHYRAAGIGLLVVLVALLATVTFTIYLTIITGVFHDWYLAAAVFWGVLIFAVDRSILVDPSYGDLAGAERRGDRQPVSAGAADPDATLVAHPDDDPSAPAPRRAAGQRLWSAVRVPVYLMRVLVAVTVAILISEALVLIIFRPEIMETVRTQRISAYETAVDNLALTRRSTIDHEVVALEQTLTELSRRVKESREAEQAALALYAKEVGGDLSGSPGHGPVARRLYEAWRRASNQLQADQAALAAARARNQPRVDALQAERTALDDESSPQRAALRDDPTVAALAATLDTPPGWLQQEKAFADYRAAHPDNAEVVLIPWLLRILLLAVDLIPLGMKLLTGSSVYGRRVAEQGQRARQHDRLQRRVDEADAALRAHRSLYHSHVITQLDRERQRRYRDNRTQFLRRPRAGDHDDRQEDPQP